MHGVSAVRPSVGHHLVIDTDSMLDGARGLQQQNHGMAGVPAAIRRAVARLGPSHDVRTHATDLASAAENLIRSLVESADWLLHYAGEMDSRSGGTRPPILQVPDLPPTGSLSPPDPDERVTLGHGDVARALVAVASQEIDARNAGIRLGSAGSALGPAPSARFISHCIERAGVDPPVDPDAGVTDWVAAAEEGRGGLLTVETGGAQAGDLIAYAWAGNTDRSRWDHLAVVESRGPEGHAHTLQANSVGQLLRHTHPIPWVAARGMRIIRLPS